MITYLCIIGLTIKKYSNMKTQYKTLKQIVVLINTLCEQNKFEEVGNIAHSTKSLFLAFAKNAKSERHLTFCVENCHIWNIIKPFDQAK